MSGSSKLKRSAFLGLALLRATASRPPSPLKLNLCLTYWCQYRCKTCNIWQRKPSDELTTDEIAALVRKNPGVNWVDLTGGEIFLRPDIDDIFDAIISGWTRLAILHFPTNGFLTDGIVRRVTRLAGRSSARLIVTVSVDGDEALNDRIRGIQGGFRRQMETFRQLREIPGVTAALGMTLSTENSGQFDRTFAACARECPGLTVNDVHLNVAQRSGHYYGNQDLDIVPESRTARAEMKRYRGLRSMSVSPRQLLEHAYLRNLDVFLESGLTPMPCHALRASCFIDPWGVVYPCITYSRPLGSLRDTGMCLEPIWNASETVRLQEEIWKGSCPQCWTACEAYPSILGNAFGFRQRRPASGRSRVDAAQETAGIPH
jgi:MoaA/NifB/PqqE/SkfB family radical SAM enzyme